MFVSLKGQDLHSLIFSFSVVDDKQLFLSLSGLLIFEGMSENHHLSRFLGIWYG